MLLFDLYFISIYVLYHKDLYNTIFSKRTTKPLSSPWLKRGAFSYVLVIEQVREAFLDARKMHRKDNVNYYFDPKKQIHYIVIDNVLVTLYKNDFGFNSKINSYITQNQYLYIKKLAKETNQSQSKLNRVLERLHKKKAYQEDRIKKMEDLLNQEKQKKLSIETEIQTNFDLKNSLNDKLSAAEKKLFKPWKVTLKEDLMQDEDKIICPDEKELDKEPVPSLVADLN